MTTTTEFNEADLPELPIHPDIVGGMTWSDKEKNAIRAFAFAAVAASRKKLMQEPYCWGVESDGEIVDTFPTRNFAFEDAEERKEIWPSVNVRIVPLYAAPMPKANESEAVKALRRVVSNYETNCSVRDAWAWHEDSYNAARAVLAGEPGAQEKGHDE